VDQALDGWDEIRDYRLLIDGMVGYDVSDMTLENGADCDS
jgi:hypothetical protein